MDEFIHPVFGLPASFLAEIAILHGKADILLNRLPDIHYPGLLQGRAGQDPGGPAGFGGGKKMQCVLIFPACPFRFLFIVPVSLCNGYQVCHLHDAPFDPLKFIPCTSKHE